jgi:hypothetical protein
MKETVLKKVIQTGFDTEKVSVPNDKINKKLRTVKIKGYTAFKIHAGKLIP